MYNHYVLIKRQKLKNKKSTWNHASKLGVPSVALHGGGGGAVGEGIRKSSPKGVTV
jgi:hypothetical protein